MPRDFDLEERKQTLANLERRLALKLLYEWTKTGVVNFRQFAELIDPANSNPSTD